jgi:hypothetical protein
LLGVFLRLYVLQQSALLRGTLPPCSKCQCTFSYEDGGQLVCPACGHEWQPQAESTEPEQPVVRDAVGNALAAGDTVNRRRWVDACRIISTHETESVSVGSRPSGMAVES